MTTDAILGRIMDLIADETRFLSGVSDDITWIGRELRTLRASLKDADDAKHKKNARARDWVQEVREIAYDAEDIIDNFIGKAAVREADRQGILGPLRSVMSYSSANHTVGVHIQKIKTRIRDLSSKKQDFDINAFINDGGGGQEASSLWSQDLHRSRRRRAHEKPEMVGMQDDIETLKGRLIDGDPNLRVVSIVGMGGSGGFLRLKFLELDCSHLKQWTAEEGSMPSLRSVELSNRDDLRTLPERVRDLLR